jgi:hypothetical protein
MGIHMNKGNVISPVLRNLRPIIILVMAAFSLCESNCLHAQTISSPDWESPWRTSLEQMAQTLTNTLKPWPVPDRIFYIEKYGAIADGTTINTIAIQKAIDACSSSGGGTVLFSKGDYVTGTIELKSGVMLQVDNGARLLGSTNLADYPDKVPQRKTIMDAWMNLRLSLIYAENCERIGIRGDGIIDGRGQTNNFPGTATSAALPGRPFLIRVIECKKIVIEDIRLRNAASWMENYLNCDDLILQHLNVQNQCNWNNDGFDIDGCHNVIVRDCFINAEDDAMCFKAAGLRKMENVLVENCHAYTQCNSLKFGTDSEADFRNVLVRNIDVGTVPQNLPAFRRRKALSGISWEAVDGGTVENILVKQAHVVDVLSPIFLRLGDRGRTMPDRSKPPVGQLRDIVFDGLTGSAERSSIISGIPGHTIQQVAIRDVSLSLPGGGTSEQAALKLPENPADYPEVKMFGPVIPASGFWLRHAEQVSFDNIHLTFLKPDARPQISIGKDAKNIWLDGKLLLKTE